MKTRKMTKKEFNVLNAFAKTKGFKDIYELDAMLKNVDRTTPEFKKWDKTKTGLEALLKAEADDEDAKVNQKELKKLEEEGIVGLSIENGEIVELRRNDVIVPNVDAVTDGGGLALLGEETTEPKYDPAAAAAQAIIEEEQKMTHGREVPDMSNSHFNGDKPACEEEAETIN